MKLFHKFLLALIIASIIPLLIFSFILLKTTGGTLKNIIDQNNANKAENVTLEVNSFFVEIDKKFDMARQIERNPGMTSAKKGGMLMEGFISSKHLLAAYLLDDSGKLVSGMHGEGVAFSVDKALFAKSSKSGRSPATMKIILTLTLFIRLIPSQTNIFTCGLM